MSRSHTSGIYIYIYIYIFIFIDILLGNYAINDSLRPKVQAVLIGCMFGREKYGCLQRCLHERL